MMSNFEDPCALLKSLCSEVAGDDKGQRKLAWEVTLLAIRKKLDLSHPECLQWMGLNPLYEACRVGNTDIVKLFVAAGAELNVLDSEGRSPLYAAVSWNNQNNGLVKQLLQWGAQVNLFKWGRCPLLATFYSMKHETAKLLIRNGADVNNVILPSFCFVESVFALNANLIMMASGVRFSLDTFEDLLDLATEIVKAGLTPRTFYVSGRNFLLQEFTPSELSGRWRFQTLCISAGFRINLVSLRDTIFELKAVLMNEDAGSEKAKLLGTHLHGLLCMEDLMTAPFPLTTLTRLAIRVHLASCHLNKNLHLEEKIDQLPVPYVVKDFIALRTS